MNFSAFAREIDNELGYGHMIGYNLLNKPTLKLYEHDTFISWYEYSKTFLFYNLEFNLKQ